MTSTYPGCVPVLDDGRVRLRAMTPADLPAVVEQSVDPETVRWTTVPSPYAPQDAADFLEHIGSRWQDEGGERIFVVELTGVEAEEAAPFAGLLDLRPGASAQHPWEVGFATHPGARGRGVMTAALRLGAAWAFERGAPSLYWYANVGNWGSRRVAWRVGMTQHGTLPRQVPGRDGTTLDAWCASLLPGQEMSPRTTWITAPVLEREGIRLRPWREEDGAAVEPMDDPAHWMGDPDPTVPRMTPDAFAAWLERRREAVASGRAVDWCIADTESDRALGDVNLFVRSGDLGDGDVAEIGYQLVPSARGRGVAARAVRLALEHGLRARSQGGLGLRRVVAETAADNEGSNATLRLSGFVEYGREHDVDPLPDGSYGDGLFWERVPDRADAPTPVDPPVLETDDGVRLRPWRRPDGASAQEPDHPSHHVPAGAIPTPRTWDDWLVRRRRAMATGSSSNWCIADAATDTPLGEVLVFVHGGTLADADTAEIGYFLYPRARGRGAAKEAVALAVGHAFASRADGGLGLRRLVAETAADNAASNAVLASAGFTRWGHEAAATAPDDSVGPADHWELLRP